VSNLKPGQSTETKVLSFTDVPDGNFGCSITRVDRSASG
jgi:hypothetical protein